MSTFVLKRKTFGVAEAIQNIYGGTTSKASDIKIGGISGGLANAINMGQNQDLKKKTQAKFPRTIVRRLALANGADINAGITTKTGLRRGAIKSVIKKSRTKGEVDPRLLKRY